MLPNPNTASLSSDDPEAFYAEIPSGRIVLTRRLALWVEASGKVRPRQSNANRDSGQEHGKRRPSATGILSCVHDRFPIRQWSAPLSFVGCLVEVTDETHNLAGVFCAN